MSVLGHLFGRLDRDVPVVLQDWERRVEAWCDEYATASPDAQVSEINLDFAVFLFDHRAERVVLAYAISVAQLHPRDAARMRGFPDVNITVERSLGDQGFPADRGHFLGHASGGALDINLFPQQRDLNRGWSVEGKRFRAMERYVAQNPGSFFYHRPVYDDDTWVPAVLEYGILQQDGEWWIERFHNKPGRAGGGD